MPLTNPTPHPKDVVIIQRSNDGQSYGEVHISGSELIFHLDSDGYINADKSASFYTLYPPPVVGELIPGNTYPITSSWTENVSSTAIINAAISSSWASSSLTASYADIALTALSASNVVSSSYADTSSFIYFDGNRTIKRSPYTTLNVGGSNIKEFIENFFFPFLTASVLVASGGTYYYETGSTQTFSISSTITANDETSFGSSSIYRDGIQWYSTTDPTPMSFAVSDSNISSSHAYTTKVQTGNNGSPTIISSNSRTASFIFPYLWGMSSTPGLSGNSLYTTFTRQVVSQGNKTVSLVGNVVYIYFAYPVSYPVLTSILDPNSFEAITNFQYSASVPVTSSGLSTNWMANYKVYRTTLLSDPNGNHQFKY